MTSPQQVSVSPKKGHTAGSAAALLMASALCSGLLGLVRIAYINDLWGPGVEQDAYRAAFQLPEMLAYFLAGSAASISLVTLLNRYREKGDEKGGHEALSVILSSMMAVLIAGVLLAEIFAPLYVRIFIKGFVVGSPRFVMCVTLTRILLPVQLFFFFGSMMSAHLQVRKIFIYQAFVPLIYNAGIILGALLLHTRLHIYSLAVGAVAGVVLGATLLNTLGALRTGLRFRPQINFRHPIFNEWLLLSLPLLLGVSLVKADEWILTYFASAGVGNLTIIKTAKDLFNAPFNIIGPAAGAASLPFFASLFQQERLEDFSRSVSRSVSRLFAVGMLVSACMIALAPWLMDLFRRGAFHRSDAKETSFLFSIFAITLAIWAVQGIYARAFYAAANTLTPALTGILATVVSIPLYWLLFKLHGLTGLAIASDLAMLVQTAALAILLHGKRLVSLSHLEYPELARALIAAIVSFIAAYALVHKLPSVTTHFGDLLMLSAGSAAWLVTAAIVLVATGSKLPRQILRRG
ncbi:murein biosynthesis integral membrane protein MurJ [Granulicella paludicola]|uniref:murein biosynthesis integral membrane protein MurJ n=1 Tax=Granulicella paludicola TaxID=474951 RepID=UPI0021DFB5DB|nr:lipid II flippase MurJ [Granulicella paludicola]